MNTILALLDEHKADLALDALNDLPNSVEVLALKGRALGKLRRYSEALSAAEQALKIDPQCAEAHNTLAAVSITRGEVSKAIKHADLATSSAAKEARFFVTRAAILASVGRLPEALADLELVETLPDGAAFVADKAKVLAGLGRVEEALAALRSADPKLCFPEALAQAKVVVHSASGNLAGALEAAEELTAISPGNVEVWLQLVRLQEGMNDASGIEQTLTRAIEHLPDEERLFSLRTQLLMGQMRSADALKLVEGELKSKGRPLSQYAISLQLLLQSEIGAETLNVMEKHLSNSTHLEKDLIFRGSLSASTNQAKEYWLKAIQLRPSADTVFEVGCAMMERGLIEDACDCYLRVTESDSQYFEAYHNWAHCLQELNQLEDAIAKYSSAIALRPDSLDSYNNRGNCYRALGHHDDAIKDHTKAIEIDDRDTMGLLNRSLTLIEVGQIELAEVDLTELLRRQPNHGMAMHLLGYLHFSSGRVESADGLYRTACQLVPDLVNKPYA